MTRPSIDEMMLEIAGVVSKRSTCPKGHVGAVIATQSGRILSLGYNGVPKGMAHCEDGGCQRGPDGKHLWLLHAEENAVINAANNGIAIAGSVIYTTHLPCSHCAAIIVQAGIIKVVFHIIHGDTQDQSYYLFSSNNITLERKEI